MMRTSAVAPSRSRRTTDDPGSFSTPVVRLAFCILLLSTLLASVYSAVYFSSELVDLRSRTPSSFVTESFYFANKRNVFNQLFVKRGWAWTTFVTALYLLAASMDTLPSSSSSGVKSEADIRATSKVGLDWTAAIKRWTIATIYWYYLTQATWFIVGTGPSLSHYVLTATGGKCKEFSTERIVEGAGVGECKEAEGFYFADGHDVSGHLFILVLATLLLLTTIAPSLPHLYRSIFDRSSKSPRVLSIPHVAATVTVLALVALWEWMLIMTSLFFHTPLEKVSGFAFAAFGWWLIA